MLLEWESSATVLHQSSPFVACMVTLFLNLATHPIALAVTIRKKLEKGSKNKVSLCDVGPFCNVQQKKVTLLRSSNLSSEIHEYRPLTSCHALPAHRRNKALEWLEC